MKRYNTQPGTLEEHPEGILVYFDEMIEVIGQYDYTIALSIQRSWAQLEEETVDYLNEEQRDC